MCKLDIFLRTKIVSFNVGDVSIFCDAGMGSRGQSHKRLINITVLLLL